VSTQLSKEIGLFGLISLSLGAMIGGGIFVLPGLAAAKMGPAVWMAYVLAGLLVLAPALAKAELATALPGAGGTYLFLERSMGPKAGTCVGLGVWMVLILKGSFALVGVGYYMVLVAKLDKTIVALVLLSLLIVLNMVGAKKAAQFQIYIVSGCLLTLLILTTGGLANINHDVGVQMTHGWTGLLAATGFVSISYAGVSSIASLSEEAKNPARDLPLSLLISLGLGMLVYAVVSWALIGATPFAEVTVTKRPMSLLARVVFGATGAKVVAVIAILALVSMANSGLMAASRYPLAMARDGLMPSFLQEQSERFRTPTASIMLTGAVMATAIATADVEKLAKLASTFQLLVFALECLCVIVFRESNPQWYQPNFRMPFYPILPAFGLVTCLAMIVWLGTVAIAGCLALFVIGMAWFFIYGRRHVDHQGLIQQLWKRPDLLPPAGLDTRRVTRSKMRLKAPTEPTDAQVVIPILGGEVSPDMLLEVGAALVREDARIEVLHLYEVPLQTALSDAAATEQDRIKALERRISGVAEALHVRADCDSVITRDVRETLYEYAKRVHCEWLVMEWITRDQRGIFFRDPLSWFLTHLPCNLALFKDAGGFHGRRILVLAEPGPHDGLVVHTADRFAAMHDAEITFMRALPENAEPWQVEAVVDYHEQLGQLCHVPTESRIVRHKNPVSAVIQASADYDLLVTGAPPERAIWGLFFGSRGDRIIEESICSVLRLKTPRKATHQAIEKKLDDNFVLMDSLEASTVLTGIEAKTKEVLFRWIAATFAQAHDRLGSADAVEQGLWRREKMQNTAIGDGLAIPHATLPGLDQTYFGLVTLPEPINYKADGAGPVDLIFVTIGPPSDRQTHLKLLAQLSGLLIRTELASDLRKAADFDAVKQAFSRALTQSEGE